MSIFFGDDVHVGTSVRLVSFLSSAGPSQENFQGLMQPARSLHSCSEAATISHQSHWNYGFAKPKLEPLDL